MGQIHADRDGQTRFLAAMDCDIDAALADRLADWRYKERLARHSHLHAATRSNTELQRMGGWQ